MTPIRIRGDSIALGQFLKFSGVAQTGGEARYLLESGLVHVNGEPEMRRGRKLQPGDVVDVQSEQFRLTRVNE